MVVVVNLDNRTIEMRPRRPWEAVDLGILMARRWWIPLMQLWLCVSLPVFFLTSFLPGELLLYQTLVLWWLKPLFERPLLFLLSQNVFGQYPLLRESLRTFPQLALKQIVLSLTWRRFSPSRALDLPVLQLEGLSGAKRAARLAVLHREGISPSSALTVFGVHLEAFISLGIIVIVFLFVPEETELPWMDFANFESPWLILLSNSIVYIGMSLIAPFYVASGFALYLNRRIHLEAWDIEIAFKRIVEVRKKTHAQKNKPATKNSSNLIVSIFLAVTLPFFCVTPDVNADDIQNKLSSSVDIESVYKEINTIKKQEEFNVRDIQKRLKNSRDDELDESEEEWDLSWLNFSSGFASWLSKTGEYVLWVLVIILIFLIVFRYREWLKKYAFFSSKSTSQSSIDSPKVLFGLEVTQESLPDDISVAASLLWRSNDKRKALALIYRASLVELIDLGVQLRSGDTEGVCLEKSKMHRGLKTFTEEKFAYLDKLTEMWQRYAYGHMEPDSGLAMSLCESWNKVWLKGDKTLAT